MHLAKHHLCFGDAASFLVLFLQLMDFQISFLNLLAGLCTELVLLQWADHQCLMVRIIPIFLFSEKEMKIWFKCLKFPFISSYSGKGRRHQSEITENIVWWWRLQLRKPRKACALALKASRFQSSWEFFSLLLQSANIELVCFQGYWWIIPLCLQQWSLEQVF